LKMNQRMPMTTKNMGTMPAANASAAMLSITTGQFQFYPCIEIVINALQTVCRGYP
jgi:hypothetical protein